MSARECDLGVGIFLLNMVHSSFSLSNCYKETICSSIFLRILSIHQVVLFMVELNL